MDKNRTLTEIAQDLYMQRTGAGDYYNYNGDEQGDIEFLETKLNNWHESENPVDKAAKVYFTEILRYIK